MKLKIPPPVQALLAALLMWLLDGRMPHLAVAIPGGELLVGFFILCAVLVDGAALVAFFRAKTTVNPMLPGKASALVTTGVYRFSRNPMYLGMLCLLTAWCLWLGNPLNLVVLVLFPLAITRFQIKPEEEVLVHLFGQEYRHYCQRVRRWI